MQVLHANHPHRTVHQILNQDGQEWSNFVSRPNQMKLNQETTQKLAELAKLEFNEQELTEIQKDLEQMIAFVEKLNEVDTNGVEPLTHVSDEENRLREDEVKRSIDIETALKNAPSVNEAFFTVPKVIKK